MRRSRIQVKPSLNSRPTRPTSDSNVGSQEASRKENESQPKSAEEGTVSSVPATAETNSSISSSPKLNFRRPAFSVRPRPSIRGLSVPNLHGTEQTPILVAPASQQKEAVSSGDAADSVAKESEHPVSVAMTLDIKEKPAAASNEKEPVIGANCGDSEKCISEDKDKSIPVEKSQLLPEVDAKITKSPARSEESDLSVPPPPPPPPPDVCTSKAVLSQSPKETADKKETLLEPKTEDITKPSQQQHQPVSVRRPRFSVQPKLGIKVPDRKPSAISQPLDNGQSLTSTQTAVNLTEVESNDAITPKEAAVNAESDKKDSDPVSIPQCSKFPVQPKTNLEGRVPLFSRLTAVDIQPGSVGISHTQDVECPNNEDQPVKTEFEENTETSIKPTSNLESTVLPRAEHFQSQPKQSFKTVEQPTSSSKTVTENLSANQADTIDDDAASVCVSEDGAKETEVSTDKVTGHDGDAASKEVASKAKEVPALSRRMRFPVRPKLGGSQSKDESPSAPIGEKTSEETLKTSNEITSVVETSVLPRRNRFQIQPKPSAKTSKPSSSPSPKVNNLKMLSSGPSLSDNDLIPKSSQGTTTLETEESKHKEESGTHLPNKQDTEDKAKELPSKSEQASLPTLSRRSRFQVQPKVGASQSKDNQPDVSVNEEKAKISNENASKSEASILPRRNRFQIQPKPSAKSTEPSSSVAASTKVGSNQSVTKKDIPLGSVEKLSTDASNKQAVDGEKQNGDATSKDAPSKIEKTAAPTLSRRSRFQVRPKLGISKDLPKCPGKPNEEKRPEKHPSKSAASVVSLLNTSKDAKRSKEDGQSASPQKNTTQYDQMNSESPKSSEKSSTDSSILTTPVKLSGKSGSLSSPLKDNIQIENIKQREYPVNVHKSPGKSGKSLPLKEKQKKPDVSVHPSDKPPDKAKMKMRDLIYWNPSSNPMKSPDAKRARPVRQSEESPPKPAEPTTDENEPIAVPQVKIGADGNIVLNEESLVINNSQPTAPVTMEVVDETDVYSNYGSFRRYTPKSKWSLKETKKFFLALSTVGTDFSLMTNLFTKKTRRDLKNKFKREERNNRWLVDKAIQQQLHFDEKLFEEMSESEEEEVEPPTKKSRQKKDSSESLKKKESKAGKSKKAPKSDSSSTAKKTKKSKKITNKDWVIGSQEDELQDLNEEIVEEEPVNDELLIVPENAPFAEDTLTRNQPEAETQANSKLTKAQRAALTSEKHSQEEAVNILMEMAQKGLESPAKQSSNMPSSAPNKHPATTMPTINTHSTTAAMAPKKTVSGRGRLALKVPTGANVPGSSGGSHVAAGSVPTTEEARDNSSLARLFLQQMGLNSQLTSLQDEIVSITEAEISNNDQIQKVILVEVQPKDQKQTVVHMYLVSRTDGSQPSANGSADGQVTVFAAQPLALPPTSSLSDTPPANVGMASGMESCPAPEASKNS